MNQEWYESDEYDHVINDNTILIKIWFLSIFPNIKVHDQDLRWDSEKIEYSINRWSPKETLSIW